MDGPLLTKSEHIVDITTHGNSSLADEQTPHEDVQWCDTLANGCVWILIQFVVTLVQTVAAIYISILTKHEQDPEQEEYMFIWIIGYTCASIATLPILCWRLCHCSETRTNEVMDFLEKMLAYFFLGWVVLFLWVFLAVSPSLDDSTITTKHFWLWMALLFFSCIRYVLPNLELAVKVFMLPIEYYLNQISEFVIKIIKGIGVICGCIDDDDD